MTSLDGPSAPPLSTEGAAASASLMIPSQAVRMSSQGSNSEQRRRKPRRRRGGKKSKNSADAEPQAASSDKQETSPKETDENQGGIARSKPKRNRNRNKKKDKANTAGTEESQTNAKADASGNQKQPSGKPRAKRKPRGKGKKFPWRRHIPPGTMDPISLDPLVSLPYPPFALVATEPYIPVPIWPVSEQERQQQDASSKDNREDEHQKRLEEQWGKDHLFSLKQEQAATVSDENDIEYQKRHYHLYDGRALAYYLISQLQFIDPLNRRDLTRDELVNLDAYLGRHGFRDLKVVEAYDAKGITMSTAGRAGQSAAGRAQIMQQEARVLLNAVFGNSSVAAVADTTRSDGLQAQYAAAEQRETRSNNNRRNQATQDVGIYDQDDGGMVIIDDDANPGLRGAGFRSATAAQAGLDGDAPEFHPNTLYSASHITSQYGHAASVRRHDFPSLSETAPATDTAAAESSNVTKESSSKPPSRSLQRITKVVKKTDPAEIQRQREAREESLRRAMLANMAFVPPGSTGYTPEQMITPGALLPTTLQPPAGPTEGQLERNRALAGALGVTPATVRQNFNSGWARPTTANIELDQFGNELNAAQYPDSLVMAARERMTEVLKLEKRWKAFLMDDTSASLPLKPMDRPLRTFVHEYSDFWKLHTESFDPEPKRYIHCVKLRDTSAPYPLLSEAARNWRGPGQLPPQEHASQQVAGQSTVSREFPPAPRREPLKLLPKSDAAAGLSEAGADTQTEAQLNSRFDALFTGRERKKLDLAPRSIPAELPPFQPKSSAGVCAADERLREKEQERARKKREEKEKKRRLLEGAFASSDEEDEDSLSSGWEEEEPLYSGSDEEE